MTNETTNAFKLGREVLKATENKLGEMELSTERTPTKYFCMLQSLFLDSTTLISLREICSGTMDNNNLYAVE